MDNGIPPDNLFKLKDRVDILTNLPIPSGISKDNELQEGHDEASQLISAALAVGVTNFAVDGTSEQNWDLVTGMGETYPSVVPCFGLHPW
ncbi:unnamed protein product [Arabidopsis lyrata]|nr:unnamed protein product [Arabidopsis lyrata]